MWQEVSTPPTFITELFPDVQIVNTLLAAMKPLLLSIQQISSNSSLSGDRANPQMPVSKFLSSQIHPKVELTLMSLGVKPIRSFISKQSKKLDRLDEPQLSSPLHCFKLSPAPMVLQKLLQTLMAGDSMGDFKRMSISPQVTFQNVGLVSVLNSWSPTQPFLQRLQKAARVLDPVSTSREMFCPFVPKQRSAQQTQLLVRVRGSLWMCGGSCCDGKRRRMRVARERRQARCCFIGINYYMSVMQQLPFRGGFYLFDEAVIISSLLDRFSKCYIGFVRNCCTCNTNANGI